MPATGDRITKRKDGRFMARYTVHTAEGVKRKTIYGKTYKEVEKALTAARANADQGLVFEGETTRLSEYLKDWLKGSVENRVRESTFIRYEGIVTGHITPMLGQIKLKDLTPADVRRLYNDKLGSGLSPRSVNYIHVTLHKALKQAVMDGMIPRNVCDAVKAPQVHREEVTPLSPDQARALLSAASGDHLEALYVVAVHTGLRQSELLGLKWTDVDLDASSLSVQRSLGTSGEFNPPKRKKSKRTVGLTTAAVEALRKHRTIQNTERLAAGPAWEDYGLIFPNTRGKPMSHRNLYNRGYKPLLKRAGLEGQGFTFHSLRHTFATTLLRKNVNPKIVQEALGHSTIAQTMDTYSHVMPGMGDVAVAAIEEAL